MKRFPVLQLLFVVLLVSCFAGCGGGSAATPSAMNPPPVVSTISPNNAVAGGAAFMLSVSGTGFEAGSTVQWNGSSRPTTFVSSTQLTATISAADIQASGNISVTVVNNTRGATSSAVNFRINPVLSWSASPASVITINTAGAATGVAGITSGTGALTLVGSPVTAGALPVSIAVDTAGKFAYVTNFNSNNVSLFSIDATGALTAAAPPVAAGNKPVAVVTAGKIQ